MCVELSLQLHEFIMNKDKKMIISLDTIGK